MTLILTFVVVHGRYQKGARSRLLDAYLYMTRVVCIDHAPGRWRAGVAHRDAEPGLLHMGGDHSGDGLTVWRSAVVRQLPVRTVPRDQRARGQFHLSRRLLGPGMGRVSEGLRCRRRLRYLSLRSGNGRMERRDAGGNRIPLRGRSRWSIPVARRVPSWCSMTARPGSTTWRTVRLRAPSATRAAGGSLARRWWQPRATSRAAAHGPGRPARSGRSRRRSHGRSRTSRSAPSGRRHGCRHPRCPVPRCGGRESTGRHPGSPSRH